VPAAPVVPAEPVLPAAPALLPGGELLPQAAANVIRAAKESENGGPNRLGMGFLQGLVPSIKPLLVAKRVRLSPLPTRDVAFDATDGAHDCDRPRPSF
jgi:hypothetical protein